MHYSWSFVDLKFHVKTYFARSMRMMLILDEMHVDSCCVMLDLHEYMFSFDFWKIWSSRVHVHCCVFLEIWRRWTRAFSHDFLLCLSHAFLFCFLIQNRCLWSDLGFAWSAPCWALIGWSASLMKRSVQCGAIPFNSNIFQLIHVSFQFSFQFWLHLWKII